jgi:manganese transport protein
MYRKILAALNATSSDQSLLRHVAELAKFHNARLLLVHVADGWAARNYDRLQLTESEEMKADRSYLESVAAKLRGDGLQVETKLALGEPAEEVLKAAEGGGCDLIAMASHGHQFWGHLFLGNTIAKVRQASNIPLLVIRSTEKS